MDFSYITLGCMVELTAVTRSALTKFEKIGIKTFSFASGSLPGYCSVTHAADSNTAMTGIHCFSNINTGVYGNSNSWIPGKAGGFAGFRLDHSNTEYAIEGLCVSRDKTGVYKDRATDTLTFEVTTADNANANSDWCTVGSIKRNGVPTELCYSFSKPINAKAVRVITNSAGTCIDELQIFAQKGNNIFS